MFRAVDATVNEKSKRNMQTTRQISSVGNHNGRNVRSWHVVLLLFMVAVLAGQFGLDRIDPRFESLGLFGQARFWMFFPAALAVLRMNAPIGSRSALSSGNKRYVAMVILLHLYLAISALWTPRLLEGSQFVSNSNEVYGVLLLAGMAALVPRLFREATDEKIGFLFRFLLITGIVYAVGGLSGAWHDADNDRMAAFGGGANVFARILGMGPLSSL